MLRRVFIDTLQKVSSPNYQDFGNYPAFTFDNYTFDLFGPGKWYAGFNIADAGSGQILVGPGRIYVEGKGYYNDNDPGTPKNLLDLAPVNLARWVAVYVVPNEDKTNTKATTFLTDSNSRDTISRLAPQEVRRMAEVGIYGGAISADPVKPLIGELPAGNAVLVGWVYISGTGIGEIVRNPDGLAPSTVGNYQALKENAEWRARTDTSIAALDTNIKAIAKRISDIPSGFLVRTMAKDIAALKILANLPDNYSAYGADHFLDLTQTDTTSPDLLVNVEEGLRFPAAAVQDMQLGLLNVYDAGVVRSGDTLLPAYTEVTRFDNYYLGEAFQINQYFYMDVGFTQLNGVRYRFRTGPYYQLCTNWVWYYNGGAGSYDALNNIIRLNTGEAFMPADPDAYLNGLAVKAAGGIESHYLFRAKSVFLDQFAEQNYMPQLASTGTISGSVIGQTWLNAQDGWMTGIKLPMALIGPTGALNVLLCETFENGEPNFKKVIGRSTLERNDLYASFVANGGNVPFRYTTPVAVKKGASYAHVLVTQGSHQCKVTRQNGFAQGSLFQCTDGRWAVADLERDLCFANLFCQFKSPRTVVQLQSLTLQGGILGVDVLAQMIQPAGTNIAFEGQFNGQWVDLLTFKDPELHPLIGLPALVPFRAVFNGTTDNQPQLGVGAYSRVRTSRPQPNMRHVSNVKTPKAPVNYVEIDTRIEAFDPAYHTAACKLRVGAGYNTLVAPTAVSDAPDPNDPKAIIRTSVFQNSGGTWPSWKFDQQTATTNVVRVCHVADTAWVCYNR